MQSLESGTVIMGVKDGSYEPISNVDFLSLQVIMIDE